VVSREVPVVVVGEYKQGKSTLINALLRTDVCPVDADLVTAVPTVIRYGTPPSVTARYAEADQPVRFDRLRE
jgi:ribosome biogenesis GTPase A